MNVPHGTSREKPCSWCGGPRTWPGQGYCRACHATYMKAYRARVKARIAAMKARLLALDAKEVHV